MRLITIPEVAVTLSISVPRAYELARNGTIPCLRFGRQIRVNPTELAALIRSDVGSLAPSPCPVAGEEGGHQY